MVAKTCKVLATDMSVGRYSALEPTLTSPSHDWLIGTSTGT